MEPKKVKPGQVLWSKSGGMEAMRQGSGAGDAVAPPAEARDADDAIPEAPPQAPDLKTLPMVGLEVLRRALDSRSNASDIEEIVRTDVALTQRLLRVANSARYWRGTRIATPREAVVTLGFNEVRRVVLTSSVQDFMGRGVTPHFNRTGFFAHCVGVGSLAQELSRALGYEDPPVAFVAGLLHDVGKTFFDQHYPEAFGRALATASEEHISLLEAERRVFPSMVHTNFCDHTAMGRWALNAWGLPETLAEVAGRHHDEPSPDVSFLAQIVQCADSLARNLNLGWSGNGDEAGWPLHFQQLGIAPLELVDAVHEGLEAASLLGDVAGIAVRAPTADAFCAALLSRAGEGLVREGNLRVGHS